MLRGSKSRLEASLGWSSLGPRTFEIGGLEGAGLWLRHQGGERCQCVTRGKSCPLLPARYSQLAGSSRTKPVRVDRLLIACVQGGGCAYVCARLHTATHSPAEVPGLGSSHSVNRQVFASYHAI